MNTEALIRFLNRKRSSTNSSVVADHVELWSLGRTRTRVMQEHSDNQVNEIVRRMLEFRLTVAIFFADHNGRIIAGQSRVLAAHEIGLGTALGCQRVSDGGD
jgi:hypothetical protein